MPESGAVHHVRFRCLDGLCPGCLFCLSDVWWCVECDAFELVWPDECPRRWLTDEEIDQIYRCILNYRHGQWHEGESPTTEYLERRRRAS
jgi:hypothetical protein